MPAERAIDPSICPLCGGANQCAMEIEKTTGVAQAPCWCTAVAFAATLIAQLPPASKGLVCICKTCAIQTQTRQH